jgi:hypothetical protein
MKPFFTAKKRNLTSSKKNMDNTPNNQLKLFFPANAVPTIDSGLASDAQINCMYIPWKSLYNGKCSRESGPREK